jgi:hypothetical protein
LRGAAADSAWLADGTRPRTATLIAWRGIRRVFESFVEQFMSWKIYVLTVAMLIMGLPGVAQARYRCAPGFAPYHGVCRPIGVYGYSNPVSGAVSGEANGAARGNAAAGPVGAAVGGAVGIATGTLTGTANMLTGR